VRDAVISWRVKQGGPDPSGYWWSLPIVAETYDGYLNDVNGFHVKEPHVHQALQSAASGAVPEGNVGGGTGMICYEFKCGIGTASRKLEEKFGGFTIGVLVQANHGTRRQLLVAGAPVGSEIQESALQSAALGETNGDSGSIIIVVATDAPLLPHQLKRLARRASLGLARTGSVSGNGSGDIFIAFSTANPGAANVKGLQKLVMLPNDEMNPVFEATVQATEEAILNALIAAETMTGRDNHRVIAIPHDRLREILKKYNRLAK
jgi:D-aminopeptidase